MQTSNPGAQRNRFQFGKASFVSALIVLVIALLGACLFLLIVLAASSGLYIFGAVLLFELGILGLMFLGTAVAAIGLLLGVIGLSRGDSKRLYSLIGVAVNLAALGAVVLPYFLSRR